MTDDFVSSALTTSPMACRFRKATSFHGHDKDELLSALQKYIRRGEIEKAQYVALELELFESLVDGSHDASVTAAKSLVTNFVNRLRVIIAEDVGIAAPLLAIAFDEAYVCFSDNRASSTNSDAWRRRASVLTMVQLLCSAPKVRLCSDIKAVFFRPECLSLAHQNLSLKALLDGCGEIFLDARLASLVSLLPDDDASLRSIYHGIITCMQEKSDRGFFWVHKLVEATKQGVAAAPRRICGHRITTAMAILFECFLRFAERGETLFKISNEPPNALWRDRMIALCGVFVRYHLHFGTKKSGSHRDHLLFAIWPALYLFRRDLPLTTLPAVAPAVSLAMARLVYRDHLSAPMLVFDDYIFDIHTVSGRRVGRGAQHFANVGALVMNEVVKLVDQDYRELYLKSKTVESGTKRNRSNNNNDDDDNDDGGGDGDNLDRDNDDNDGAFHSSTTKKFKDHEDDGKVSHARSNQIVLVKSKNSQRVEFLLTIERMSNEQASALNSCPLGQRPCSLHKALVHMVGDRVLKGPFLLPGKRASLALALFRQHVFSALWQDNVSGPFVLRSHPENVDAIFIDMPNLSAVGPDAWQLSSRQEISTSTTSESMRSIVDQQSLGLVEFHEYLRRPTKTTDVCLQAIRHFINRFVIDPSVGDATPRNVVVVNSRAIGIDFEENRQQVANDAASCGYSVMTLVGDKRWRAVDVSFLDQVIKQNTVALQQHLRVVCSSLVAVESVAVQLNLQSLVCLDNIRRRIAMCEECLEH